MFSVDAGLMVWTLFSILLPISALVGVVFVVRFFIRLSRRVEQLNLRMDSLVESLGEARNAKH